MLKRFCANERLTRMLDCVFDVYFKQLDELNITAIRRMLLKFERAVKKNADQRSKFPDDPTKYVFLLFAQPRPLTRKTLILNKTHPHTPCRPKSYSRHDIYRFIDSEADLDAAITSLLPLAQSPALAYPELIKSDIIVKLVDLMSHENVDIVIDVVGLLHELTDEDVGGEGEESEEDEDDLETGRLGRKSAALKMLIDSLVRICSDKNSWYHLTSFMN